MFGAPSGVLVARISGAGGIGFLACHLVALSMRGADFQPTTDSAAMEHLGAMLFTLFAIGLAPMLRKWEQADSEGPETPASDGARVVALLLAGVLLITTLMGIATRGTGPVQDIGLTLELVCLVPLSALMPFVTIAARAPNAPMGFAIAGWVVAIGGLVRASALFVEKESSIFAARGVAGGIAFGLFATWVAVGGFIAFRTKPR